MVERGERRFPWIEASLRFTGRFGVREKAYRDRFGLTDSMVSRDQDTFLRLFNDRCERDAACKRQGRICLAEGVALPEEPLFPPLPTMTQWLADALGASFERVPPVRRTEPRPAILEAIVQAIAAQQRLRLQYQARRSGESTRIISPHTIVDVVGRLHLRGWDHGRNAPRDFVLSRVLSANVLYESRGYVSRETDAEWGDYVTIEVLLADGEDLSAVRPDYDLDEFGRATRRVRRAHVRYLLEIRDQGCRNPSEHPPIEGRPMKRFSRGSPRAPRTSDS